jgi:hypothetical protein
MNPRKTMNVVLKGFYNSAQEKTNQNYAKEI